MDGSHGGCSVQPSPVETLVSLKFFSGGKKNSTRLGQNAASAILAVNMSFLCQNKQRTKDFTLWNMNEGL